MGTLERTLKQLYDRFCNVAKRRKAAKLVLAISAVTILSVILSGLIVVTVSSLYQASSTISSVGTFKAIGIDVYKDESLTNKVTTIDWGFLTPGSTKTYTIYISNEGITPLTLRLFTSNWNPPSATNYITLTWDYDNGQTINAGKSVEVALTLTVSGSITGVSNFNFDITAEGTV